MKFILEKVKELRYSANFISKHTTLTEAGIRRIINGTSKNPQENTLNELILFLENQIIGTDTNTIKELREPKPTYHTTDPDKLIECLQEKNNLTMEIVKLHELLRKNNIEFSNYFENKK